MKIRIPNPFYYLPLIITAFCSKLKSIEDPFKGQTFVNYNNDTLKVRIPIPNILISGVKGQTTGQKIIVGTIAVLVLASAVYVTMQPKVRIRVDNDKTTFYVRNVNNRWVVSGREYVSLFDGSSKMNRRLSGITISTVIDNITNITVIAKRTPYIRGPIIEEIYLFDGNVNSVELFPIYHRVNVINGSGFFLRYEVRDLVYGKTTYKLSGETELEFGRNMKVQLHSNYRWAWVYKSGIVKSQYDINSDFETFNFRLFDPDATPPLWNDTDGYLGSTLTVVSRDDEITMFSSWEDETGLHWVILSTNESGIWRNYTMAATFYDFVDTSNNKAYNNTASNTPILTLSLAGETEFNTYTAVDASDNTYFNTTSTINNAPYHKFNITINETVSKIFNISISWEGRAGIYNASLYVWNFTKGNWTDALDTTIGVGSPDNNLVASFSNNLYNLNDVIDSENHTVILVEEVLPTITNLTIDNRAVELCGLNASFDKIEVINGGSITVCVYSAPTNCEGGGVASGCGYIELRAENITIDATSKIYGAGKGWGGGSGGSWNAHGNDGKGPGKGGGGGDDASTGGGGGGGGHAASGAGGGGTQGGGGGPAYNTTTGKFVEKGSGGGGGGPNPGYAGGSGGAGGGYVILNASNGDITIYGSIIVNGTKGSNSAGGGGGGGGGSGGGVLIWARNLYLDNSIITALGGIGGSGGNAGGAGSGGRIKFFYKNISNASSTTSGGSIYFELNSSLFTDQLMTDYVFVEVDYREHYGSPIYMNETSAEEVWANNTWANSSVPSYTVVSFRYYGNDTAGNQNKTGIYNFTVYNLSITVDYPPGTPHWDINASSCYPFGSSCYQTGNFTPINQSTSQWFYELNNTGEEIVNITVRFNTSLPYSNCTIIGFYLTNSSADVYNTSAAYNITHTDTEVYRNFAVDASQTYWSWLEINDCTPGTYVDLESIWNITRSDI